MNTNLNKIACLVLILYAVCLNTSYGMLSSDNTISKACLLASAGCLTAALLHKQTIQRNYNLNKNAADYEEKQYRYNLELWQNRENSGRVAAARQSEQDCADGLGVKSICESYADIYNKKLQANNVAIAAALTGLALSSAVLFSK